MIAKEELLRLKTKILPSGADAVLDFLAQHHQQIEMTNIALENVPLLIIGRQGILARISTASGFQKASQPKDIMALISGFLQKNEILYVFINLPDLPIPTEVTAVLEEVQKRANRKEELKKSIDEALDTGNQPLFVEATNELNQLSNWGTLGCNDKRPRNARKWG